jgi:hypothetical protein
MSNQFERARDLRQLRFMQSTIRSYESGSSTLPRLIEDLEELLLSISESNPDWREQFHAAWSVLEERYTLLLERDADDVDEASTTYTAQAVQRLNDLVSREIERHEREQPGA